MRQSAWNWVLTAVLTAGLAAAGCAKKQVRQESGLTPPSSSTSELGTAPEAGPSVSEGTLAASSLESAGGAGSYGTDSGTAIPSEPPPPRTGAMERAYERPVPGGGLAGQNSDALKRIYFGFDQAALTAGNRDILSKNAKYLEEKPGTKIRIEGHCDERGTAEYNLALGERRAQAAYLYLTDLGIDSNIMTTVSYGKEDPVDPGHTETAWAKNRRDEFVVIQ